MRPPYDNFDIISAYFGRVSQLYATPYVDTFTPCAVLYLVAGWMLIGACNPVLCPIHVFRPS